MNWNEGLITHREQHYFKRQLIGASNIKIANHTLNKYLLMVRNLWLIWVSMICKIIKRQIVTNINNMVLQTGEKGESTFLRPLTPFCWLQTVHRPPRWRDGVLQHKQIKLVYLCIISSPPVKYNTMEMLNLGILTTWFN